MKVHLPTHLPIVVAAALFLAGCEKADETQPEAPRQPPAQQESPVAPMTPSPPLPETNPPTDNPPPTPQPGQANDHSNPAFKSGGKPDPTN